MRKLLCIIIISFFISCSSEKPAEIEGKKTPDAGSSSALESSQTQNNEVLSNIIKIQNTPPVITKVKIVPEVFKPGDKLGVEADGSDIDGDSVTILYEWTKNGEPAGSNRQIVSLLKRGDKVSIKTTPFDGEEYGQSVVLQREIRNLPPMIIDEDKKFNFDGKVYSYQVVAVDPDGDALTYSLASGKEEIKIDPQTGLIIWNVPDDFIGDVPITVSVKDGNGGESTQALTISIQNEEIKQVRGGQ